MIAVNAEKSAGHSVQQPAGGQVVLSVVNIQSGITQDDNQVIRSDTHISQGPAEFPEIPMRVTGQVNVRIDGHNFIINGSYKENNQHCRSA
jgi:hypothetical protein